MMTIDTTGRIVFDGEHCGYSVTQQPEKTVLYNTATGESVTLPCVRYSLAHDAPASGVPGRARFEADVRAFLGRGDKMTPLQTLRHHVSGAIARGEAIAIIEQPAPKASQTC